MKRFMLWLCKKNFHRGDMTWFPGKGTSVDCNTCGKTIVSEK